jgi:hypothetical protein
VICLIGRTSGEPKAPLIPACLDVAEAAYGLADTLLARPLYCFLEEHNTRSREADLGGGIAIRVLKQRRHRGLHDLSDRIARKRIEHEKSGREFVHCQ